MPWLFAGVRKRNTEGSLLWLIRVCKGLISRPSRGVGSQLRRRLPTWHIKNTKNATNLPVPGLTHRTSKTGPLARKHAIKLLELVHSEPSFVKTRDTTLHGPVSGTRANVAGNVWFLVSSTPRYFKPAQQLPRRLPPLKPHEARTPLTMPPRLNIPPITRILLIALISQSLLSFAIRYRQWTAESDIVVPYLVLVPQLSLIYPWTFLSTTLVENNMFMLGIGGVTLFYGGRYLERAWTSGEFAKFLLVVTGVSNVVVFGILVSLFAMTGDLSWR